MKTVFADAVYWIAVIRPNDPWRQPAIEARKRLGEAHLVTTDEVLTEFLTALSKGGPNLRRIAAEMARAILSNANVKVIPQSHESFRAGLARYDARSDKQYSPQDCISMNAMEAESISEVLTNDGHFQQDGFTVLMTR